MARSSAINLKNAWNTVALEERLELLNSSKAHGIIAASASFFFIGAVAYGFDKVWLLIAASCSAFIVMPLFTNHSWRQGKSKLILSYLAARSIARRHAHNQRLDNLEILLIFRGKVHPQYDSEEEAILARQASDVEIEGSLAPSKDVWICLFKGGIVALSERRGGARLEFLCGVSPNLSVKKGAVKELSPSALLVTTGDGKRIAFSSPYSGALLVFEKQLTKLISEAAQMRALLEQAKQKSTVAPQP